MIKCNFCSSEVKYYSEVKSAKDLRNSRREDANVTDIFALCEKCYDEKGVKDWEERIVGNVVQMKER